MIGKEQSNFQIAIEEIKNFLIKPNQNSKMKELLTKSLSDLKEHKQLVNERQSVLFLLDKELKLKDIQFIKVTLESKNKQVNFQSGKLHYEDSSIVNWSIFHNISKEDHFITITNLSGFEPIMEAVVYDKVTSEIEDEIQLFFNTELKRFLDQLDTYFTSSYLNGWVKTKKSDEKFDSQLFFSSNFLSPEDVREIYELLQSSNFLFKKFKKIKREVEKENQFEALSPYLLWENFNPEFKTIKWKIFEESFVVKTFSPFWSDDDFIKLFSEWTHTLSGTDTEKAKDCYIDFSSSKLMKIVEFFINKFYHQDSTKELVLKFVSTITRFLLTSSAENCGADFCNSIDEDDYDEFTNFIFKLFREDEWLVPLLEQFQEGESINVVITDEKYLNLSYSNEILSEILSKLIEERNVKINITLEEVKEIYSAVNYERDNLSFIVYDIYNLWGRFEDNVTVTVSEKDYQTLMFYKQGVEDKFLDEYWYSNVPEILEVIDNSKRI